MTQSLLNLLNSPLAIAATILWLLVLWLILRQCQRWSKERDKEKVTYQNHPAIPVKIYKLSDFEGKSSGKLKPVNHESPPIPVAPEHAVQSLNAWDI